MCMFSTPSYAAPQLPAEPQQARSPDAGAAKSSVTRRVGDRLRSGMSTILTGGQGAFATAPTGQKTLLGQ